MFVTRYPTLFVLKDGGYERYHGEQYSLFQICILYSLFQSLKCQIQTQIDIFLLKFSDKDTFWGVTRNLLIQVLINVKCA